MSWDFETDPEYQAQLDWADEFVREEVEPLDLVCARGSPSPRRDARLKRSSIRSRRRCGATTCGPPTSAPSSAARATAS